MIGIGYVQRMALYNRWQNENLYGTADRLNADEERRRERGAFFGSIQKTLEPSLAVGGPAVDEPLPRGRSNLRRPGMRNYASLYPDWEQLKSRRVDFDAEIVRWAEIVNALTG